MDSARRIFLYLFDAERGARHCLISRWIFLRALGLIYFSAFFALLFQVKGLIGPRGILPAAELLQDARGMGALRFWAAPTLLWISSGDYMLMALMWIGLIASVLLVVNFWPRAMLIVCFVCFLSFVSAAQDFSGYQSDGMLLAAGSLSIFLAPGGFWPGWGAKRLAARAAYLLLLWEWFRIYFESGVVKLASGDPTWRNLTAMYEYYQNGPLPTWIGWYAEQMLPHWFQRGVAGATLVMELVLIWMVFLPRPVRIVLFFIVTAWQIGVIATANYAFLNYLVLVLAFLLLDDTFLLRFVPERWRGDLQTFAELRSALPVEESPADGGLFTRALLATRDADADSAAAAEIDASRPHRRLHSMRMAATAVVLLWIGYATTVPLVRMFFRDAPLPNGPVAALEPFRIANQYGLFAVMTPHRYEIEFQGSNDGQTWTAYPFRYKPQDVHDRPRIYAPYQPRFDWNLWFASLGSWMQNPIVPRTEELLLENDSEVLGLFAGNPFPNAPPKYVRAVLWQYWFSTPEQKRTQGMWWTRQLLGTYAPTLVRRSNGKFAIVQESTLSAGPSS